MVEDDNNTCRDCGGCIADIGLQEFWWIVPQTHKEDGFQAQSSKSRWSSSRRWKRHIVSSRSLRWGTTTQSHGEPAGIECIDLELDHFALGLSGLAKKLKGKLILCNSALVDKEDANPTNLISLALLLFSSLLWFPLYLVFWARSK
jgi:hypothetical protein